MRDSLALGVEFDEQRFFGRGAPQVSPLLCELRASVDAPHTGVSCYAICPGRVSAATQTQETGMTHSEHRRQVAVSRVAHSTIPPCASAHWP
jgi:hypothetical protein